MQALILNLFFKMRKVGLRDMKWFLQGLSWSVVESGSELKSSDKKDGALRTVPYEVQAKLSWYVSYLLSLLCSCSICSPCVYASDHHAMYISIVLSCRILSASLFYKSTTLEFKAHTIILLSSKLLFITYSLLGISS